jgi:hypothetical protein
LVVYGSYDVTPYIIGETVFNTTPTTPAFLWPGNVQECGFNLKPNPAKIYAINNLRTLSRIVYTKKMWDYRMVYYPFDTNLFSYLFWQPGTATNSFTIEEAYRPIYGSSGDVRFIRMTGVKADRGRINWKVGDPVQVELDLMGAGFASGNPFTTTIAGSTYASEPASTLRPYYFQDQSATVDGSQIYALELSLDYQNQVQRDPYGYYIGSDVPRILPAGRNPIGFSITTNWEDFNKLTDVTSEAIFTVVLPFGPTHTITLAGCKWDNIELMKQVTRDILAPKVPGTALTATLA